MAIIDDLKKQADELHKKYMDQSIPKNEHIDIGEELKRVEKAINNLIKGPSDKKPDVVDESEKVVGAIKSSVNSKRAEREKEFLPFLQEAEASRKRASDNTVRESFERLEDAIKTYINSGGDKPNVASLKRRVGLKIPSLLPEKKEESTSNKLRDKLLREQIKQIQSTKKPLLSGPKFKFSLPTFAVENATGIVIVELVALILLQIHAGTTLVTLWNYAFSPNATSTPINNNKTAQMHGSNNSSLQSRVPMSVVPASGTGVLEVWGVPTEYSYSGGYNW